MSINENKSLLDVASRKELTFWSSHSCFYHCSLLLAVIQCLVAPGRNLKKTLATGHGESLLLQEHVSEVHCLEGLEISKKEFGSQTSGSVSIDVNFF